MRRMLKALRTSVLRRPSIAVGACCIVVVAGFALTGNLRLRDERRGEPPRVEVGIRSEPAFESVAVRRTGVAPRVTPSVTRSGRVFDSMGFLLVSAKVAVQGGDAVRTGSDGSFTVDLAEDRAHDLLVRADGRRSRWLRTSPIAPDPLLVCLEPAAPWDSTPAAPEPMPELRGEGTLVDVDGAPLPFAFVNVCGTECWARADATGRVVVPLPAAESSFAVHRPAVDGEHGSLASISAPFVASRSSGLVPLPVLRAVAAGSIRGQARDANGDAVAGLPIEVRGAGCRRRTETGPGGVFELSGLVPADYEVAPFPYRGAMADAVAVRVDRAVVACDVQLREVEQASIRVVDQDGAAARGVWVAAEFDGLRRSIAQTDDDGLVQLPIVRATRFEVRTDGSFVDCEVREFDAVAEPARMVIAQP